MRSLLFGPFGPCCSDRDPVVLTRVLAAWELAALAVAGTLDLATGLQRVERAGDRATPSLWVQATVMHLAVKRRVALPCPAVQVVGQVHQDAELQVCEAARLAAGLDDGQHGVPAHGRPAACRGRLALLGCTCCPIALGSSGGRTAARGGWRAAVGVRGLRRAGVLAA